MKPINLTTKYQMDLSSKSLLNSYQFNYLKIQKLLLANLFSEIDKEKREEWRQKIKETGLIYSETLSKFLDHK